MEFEITKKIGFDVQGMALNLVQSYIGDAISDRDDDDWYWTLSLDNQKKLKLAILKEAIKLIEEERGD